VEETGQLLTVNDAVALRRTGMTGHVTGLKGLMEFAGVDKAARSKTGVWKMQEWTYRHGMAKVDNAGEKTYPSRFNVQVKNVTVSQHFAN